MKYNHIRHALESREDTSGTSSEVTIKGPLSNLYTEILHCLYKKSDNMPAPPATDLNQYSQGSLVLANENETAIRQAVENATSEMLVIDTAMSKTNSAILTNPTQTMVYAISPAGVSDTDIKAIVNEKILADQNSYNFAVVAPDVIINQSVQTKKIETADVENQQVTLDTAPPVLDGAAAAHIALEMLSVKYGIEVVSSREFIKGIL